VTDEQIVSTIKNGKQGTPMPAWSGKLTPADILAAAAFVRSLGTPTVNQPSPAAQPSKQEPSNVYKAGDDVLFTLPTGRPLDRHSLDINFTHRFVFDPTFAGPARGGDLFGLDGFGLASFGLRYGITNKFFMEVYRSPTFIGRPIQLLTGYRLLDERNGHPLNAVVRVSMQGRNNFSREFSESFEVIASRSLGPRAQVYVVPTVTVNNHRLVQPTGVRSRDIPATPRVNSFALGIGASFDVRPTVALVAEVSPTLVGQDELGVDHPAFSFGVQKKIFRHAFTLGFTNTPGTTVADRSQTRAAYLGVPGSDGASGLFIGFDLRRQLH
jgi:hypothetical protein